MTRKGGAYALFIERPVATTMMVLAIATFGAISLTKIPLELLPEISYPTVTVRTQYAGAGPEDVEERVSKRLEETLAVLPGLKHHSSISRAGVSDVVLEYQWGTNLTAATQEIRERLDRTPLPAEAEKPLILKYDPNLDPVMRLSLSGNADLKDLRVAADEILKRGLATVQGVAAPKVRGGLEDEIRVRLDEKKITSLGLDISEVDRRLKIENVNLASGTLVEGDTEYLVRTLNQFATIDEILELAVADRGGAAIRLKEIASVERTHKKRDVITRVDGLESVELLIQREADANIVDLADAVRKKLFGSEEDQKFLADIRTGKTPDPEVELRNELLNAKPAATPAEPKPDGMGGPMAEENPRITELRALVAKKRAALDCLKEKLPPGFEVRVISDQSGFIRTAIDEVRGSTIIGGILSVLILLLFLKDSVATAIISISIPLSIVATFAPMYLFGVTFNIMSLGGLALGIGMLVDNSIVVLESIYRCREEGDDDKSSALRGTKEVGLAVSASTFTSIAVFFPIVFVEGVAGQIFGDQSLTVVFSVLSSLAVALFFLPMLAARVRMAGAKDAAPKRRLRDVPPLKFIAEVAPPLVLPPRLIAWRGYNARSKASILQAILFFPLLPIQVALELCSRVVLVLAAVALFVVGAVFRVIWKLLALLATPIRVVFDFVFDRIANAYPHVIRACIRTPLAAVLTILVLMSGAALCFSLFPKLGTELLPAVHQGEVMVHCYLPVGTPVERAAATMLPIEQEIAKVPEVMQVASAIGVGRDEIAEPDEGSHSARMLLELAGGKDPAAIEDRVVARVRTILEQRPELSAFRFSRPTLFSIKAPLEVQAKGNDLDALRDAAAEIAQEMRKIDGVNDVRSTVTRGSPEVRLTFDREKLRRYGLDIEAIANRVRAQVQGVVSTRFADGERRVDVRVQADIDTVEKLFDVTVNRGRAMDLSDTLDRGRAGGGESTGRGTASIQDRTLFPGLSLNLAGGAPIPLRSVADVTLVEGPSEIRRLRGQRAALVTASATRLDVGGIVKELERVATRVESKHADLVCAVGGQGAEMGDALQSMKLALYLAVFLVYLVMASQFESIIQPLIILLSVPLALAGAVLGLWKTGTPISVVVVIGVIVLAGIVVSNAIVLLDYTNQLRARGRSTVEALAEAGRARLRPILMTKLTTIFGLLPLTGVFERIDGLERYTGTLLKGSELEAPMAVTVIGGLSLATLLTLLVIPAVYRLVIGEKKIVPAEALAAAPAPPAPPTP